MTSFLTDVLITAGKQEKIDLQNKTLEIQKQITKLKSDVQDCMHDNYVEFSSKFVKDQDMVLKVAELIDEMKVLQKRIDDQIKIELSGSMRELENLSSMLKESIISLQLSDQLLSLHEYIKSTKQFLEEKRYEDAATTLSYMQPLLDNVEGEFQELEIYVAINEEYSNLYSTFLLCATALWHERIRWTGIEDDKTEKKVVTLTIDNGMNDVEDLIRGLYRIDNLSIHLQNFLSTVMEHLIRPITSEECSVYVVNEKTFTVEILDKKNTPTYVKILHDLEMLFKFLHQHFNILIEVNQTLLALMRLYLLDDLSKVLTMDCLSQTIPTSSAELKNFEPVVEAIKKFQDFLLQINFITDQHLFLSEYSQNIDKLFINKMCQELITKARSIMKKDLHDSITYSPQKPLRFPDDMLGAYEGMDVGRRLSDVSFQLPSCQISKNAKEILDLAKSILDEACQSSDNCATRLFYTCRNIFEMYVGLVPEHHKKFLETIPQQVALFHNNCMFLAHHLLTLAHEYRDKLPKSLHHLNLTFVDISMVLHDAASEYFLEHMRYQRNIIIDILKDSGLSVLGQTSELPSTTERVLRQCIRQLELLKTVWLDVLPINIYCRAVGCITNSMIDDLIVKVTNVEDIPAYVATELVVLFGMVAKRAPLIFPDTSTIVRHVQKWNKFVELIKVLGASLKEIEVRWENGHGPLSKEFTASQVKQLVRALFQNTERRANLLATIK